MGTLGEVETWLDAHAAPLIRATRQKGVWYVVVSNRVNEAVACSVSLESAFARACEKWCYECHAARCDK